MTPEVKEAVLGTTRGLREQLYRATVLRAIVSSRQQGLGRDQSSQEAAPPFPSCTHPPSKLPALQVPAPRFLAVPPASSLLSPGLFPHQQKWGEGPPQSCRKPLSEAAWLLLGGLE